MSVGDWRITTHAVSRAKQRGFTLAELRLCADQPEVSYTQSNRATCQEIRQRGPLAVVVDSHDKVIISVLARKVEQWTDSAEGPVACTTTPQSPAGRTQAS